MNKDLQDFITEHCKRIATLQNSKDPNKHALIALLAKEIGQAKEKLALNKEESKGSHGPSGPNVDKQYAWPDDVEDDCYHMEEVH
jgi:hypothetical protein